MQIDKYNVPLTSDNAEELFAPYDIVIDGDLSDLPVSEAEVRTALSWAGCIAGALTIPFAWTPPIGGSGITGLVYVDARYTDNYNTGSDLFPQKMQLGLATNVPGLTLEVDGAPVAAPFTDRSCATSWPLVPVPTTSAFLPRQSAPWASRG